MSYVVLARKWRPQTFDDLTGQEHVARTLGNAIDRDRVPHAMLFTGARGVGKTSSARILAMALNCAEGPTRTPCGVCSSCVEVQQGRSTDVLEIDGASNRGINEIRELRDGVRYAPQRDRSKIYIIDEVHMLTTEAFNALLKTLEEPPPHVVFIFATTEAQKIPVTILSRCQRFDFRSIGHRDIVGRLRHIVDAEGIEVDDEVLALVARQAAGSMRDALSLMDQIIAFSTGRIDAAGVAEILGAADRRRLFELSDAMLSREPDRVLGVVEEVLRHGVDPVYFTAEWVSHLRDLTVVRSTRDPSQLTALTDSELEEARRQVSAVHPSVLQRAFELMVGEAEAISRASWPRLVLEMALLRLCDIEPVHRIEEIVLRLEALAGGHSLPVDVPALDRGGRGGTGAARDTTPPGERRESRPEAGGDEGSGTGDGADDPDPAPPSLRSEPAPMATAPVVGGAAEVARTSGSTTRAGGGDVALADGGEPDGMGAGGAPVVQSDVAPSPEPSPENRAVRAAEAEEPVVQSGVAPSSTLPANVQPSAIAEGERAVSNDPEGAAVAPAGGELEPSGEGKEKGVSSGTGNAQAGGEGLSLERWRGVVRGWDARREAVGRLLARLWMRDDGEVVRLAAPEALEEQLDEELAGALADELSSLLGREGLRVETLSASLLDDADLASWYRVVGVEEEEREAHQREARAWMESHPVVREIREVWPDVRARFRVNESTE